MHDFTSLYAQYPAIIALMPKEFTSHEFILHLAQQNQSLYIEALNHYRADAAPFRRVHAVLSQRLQTLGGLVTYLGHVETPDIFGDLARNATWRKV